MGGINETIVREYFELHGFLVRQYRKHVAPAGREDDDIDFLVLNPAPQKPAGGGLAFVLGSGDLAAVERAIVMVKAWHTEVFSPALLNGAPELFRFLEKRAFQQAMRTFGRTNTLKILVVPSLPQDAGARDQTIAILRSKGMDAAISFRTMLADLVREVEPNRNYQKSDLLQTFRILKNYEFLRDPQLELFKPRRRKRH